MVTIKSLILTLVLLDVTISVFYIYVHVMNSQEFSHTQELLLEMTEESMKFKDHLDLLQNHPLDKNNEFFNNIKIFSFFRFKFKYFNQI